MSAHIRTLATYIGAFGIIGGALLILINQGALSTPASPDGAAGQAANVASVHRGSEARSSPPEIVQKEQPASPTAKTITSPVSSTIPPPSDGRVAYVARVRNLYTYPPEPFSVINEITRAALVNILCTAQSGSLRPIAGSGVFIDPRGIILTNAHVAQYVLLAQSSETNLSCAIRMGSPARALWEAEVLYIPPIWIREHYKDITNDTPTGTGEHDYALLRIIGTRDAPSPPQIINLPAIPLDTREGTVFPGDTVLAASYPAEFSGGTSLFPLSSIAPIQELLTFETNTVDLVSLGGIAGAQSGSSGGPIVNAWGHIIGIITTTSEGPTTAERNLRAITLNYVNRDIATQSGIDLAAFLLGDVAEKAAEFKIRYAPALIKLLIDEISSP